jgi:hypothetical protein
MVLGVALAVAACNEGTAPGDAAKGSAAGPTPSASAGSRSGISKGRLALDEVAADQFAFVEILSPEENHLTGKGGSNFSFTLVPELELTDLEKAGFTGIGKPLKSLVVLVSTNPTEGKSCQNLASRFYTDIMNRTAEEVEFLNSWRITTARFPSTESTTLLAAIVGDLNADGKYNDAPSVVPDANSDGVCDATDIEALKPVSPISEATFTINPN